MGDSSPRSLKDDGPPQEPPVRLPIGANDGANSDGEPADVETADKIEAARRGCRASLGELFENCRNYLLLVANTSVGEGLRARVAASDLVQETFLEAGAIFERFTGDSEEQLLRWLTRILENKLGNAVKRHRTTAKRDLSREVRPGSPDADKLAESLRDDASPSPSNVIAANEENQRLQAALTQLPYEYARVIDLRVNQALAYADVGRLLDRSEEAARKLFVRAIDELRSRMKHDDQPANH
jgi:RNA polymerase sigma-70 factor, ECF subfamily